MRSLTIMCAAVSLLAGAWAAPAHAYTPPGFFGISPQGPLEEEDFALMERAGVRSVRLPLIWAHVQRRPFAEPDWSDLDRSVRLAAEYDMRVFPFVWGTPDWLARKIHQEPVLTGWQRRQWASFLRAAVWRYGPYGDFWQEQEEDLPFLPVRQWEIWNEENIVTFSRNPSPRRFARLIRLSGRVIHNAHRGARVIVGGLFGRPLQTPPNIQPGHFLSELYRARRVKKHFDGIALHPYVARASAMRAEITNLRRVMRIHNDGHTPLYVTELGWGSNSNESRWERGFFGQAVELDRAFGMLSNNRRRWRIGGVWWFTWADQTGTCQFCDSAGLLTAAREAKPSWYRFNAWTGGDSEGVARASLSE